MNLYIVGRTDDYCRYDNTMEFLICESSEEEAIQYHPDGGKMGDKRCIYSDTWVDKIEDVSVKFIGVAAEDIAKGEILIVNYLQA